MRKVKLMHKGISLGCRLITKPLRTSWNHFPLSEFIIERMLNCWEPDPEFVGGSYAKCYKSIYRY